MKHSLRIFISCSCLVIYASIHGFAREWRGIVPLHTTRAEVIKLLGNPKHATSDYRDVFILENETVTFKWIDPTCVRKYPVELDNEVRPDDLVLSISVTPKKPIPLADLRLPSDKFYFMDCFGNSGCTFIDLDGEYAYFTSKEGVTGFSFGVTSKEFKAWLQEHRTCQPSNQS